MPQIRKMQIASPRHISKAEKTSKARQEELLKVNAKRLVPPAWLSEQAAAEFSRVVKEAKAASIIDNLDLGALAMYAEAYSHVQELFKKLDEEGDIITVKGAKNTYTKVNPALKPLEQYTKTIMQCSSKLGLFATDRLKLIVPAAAEKKPENPFVKYIEGTGTDG